MRLPLCDPVLPLPAVDLTQSIQRIYTTVHAITDAAMQSRKGLNHRQPGYADIVMFLDASGQIYLKPLFFAKLVCAKW